MIYANPRVIVPGGFLELVDEEGEVVALLAQWLPATSPPVPIVEIISEVFEEVPNLDRLTPIGSPVAVEVPTDPTPRRELLAQLWRVPDPSTRIAPPALHDGATRWPGRCRGAALVDP
jgi:hypothetical protein